MARHESDMHQRLRQALYAMRQALFAIQEQQSEIDALREALRKAEEGERAWAEIARNLFVNQDTEREGFES